MKTIRIFISSPGDVAEERERARQVIDSLKRRYAGVFQLKPVLWEDLPLQADMSFQQGIDLLLSGSHGIDVAVFILWSRLGSPLGTLIRRPDGSEYRSGTEREFDLMLRARKHSGGERPAFLVYTRRDETSFEERLRGIPTSDKENLISQKRLVERFIEEEFHDTGSGHNMRAYHSFDRPQTFSQRLRAHIMELLDAMAGGVVGDAVWDVHAHGPPFMGLEAYGEKQAAVFSGRDGEILEVRRALAAQARDGCAFLLLSGTSGSGKSSLARAGLLPAIAEHELDETVAEWRCLALSPSELGANPVAGLLTHLAAPGVLPGLRSEGSTLAELADLLARDPTSAVNLLIKRAVAEASAQRKGGVRILLLLDQLEELFARQAPEVFLAVIEALARSGIAWIVATVRSDFLGEVKTFPTLVRLISGQGIFPVLPPDADALRRMIEEPARLAGLEFEEKDGRRLSDRVLADAARHADLLPLVAYVLRELFDQRDANGTLTWQAYESLGGVEGALASRADAVLATLPAAVQATLSSMLKCLVTLGETSGSTGDGGERLIRQRVELSRFPSGTPARQLIDAFIAGRLFTAADHGDGQAASVTLAHEALLRVWPAATAWAAENRDILRTRARVAARMRESAHITEGDPLLEAARYALAHDPEAFGEAQSIYITDSLEAADSALRRRESIRRKVMVGLAALAMISLSGGGISLWQWREASRQKDAANQERIKAEQRSRQVASLLWLHRAEAAETAGNPEAALAFATHAYAADATFDSRTALIQKLIDGPEHFLAALTFAPDGITAVAWCQAGERLAVGLTSGAVQLIHGESARLLAPAREGEFQADAVMDLAFESEDALQVMHESGALLRHPLAAGGVATELRVASGHAQVAAFSQDAMEFATSDDAVRIATTRDPNRDTATFSPDADFASSLDFSPRSQSLAIGLHSGAGGLFDSQTFQAIRPPDGHRILAAAWHPDASRLAWGIANQGIELWETATTPPRRLAQIPTGAANATHLAWQPGGTRIFASLQREIACWDVASKPIESLPFHARHPGTITAIQWNAQGTRLASGDDGGILKIWNHQPVGPVRRHHAPSAQQLHGLDASPSGKWIAAGSEIGQVVFWDAATGTTASHMLSRGNAKVHVIAWAPVGEAIAWADDTGHLALAENSAPGSRIDTIASRGGFIWQIAWSPDGNALYSTGHDGAVAEWNARTKQSRTLHQLPGGSLGLAIQPSGVHLAAASAHGDLHIFRATDGSLVKQFQPHETPVGALAWSPDGRWLASAGNDGRVVRIEHPLDENAKVAELPHPLGNAAPPILEALTFSPCGGFLAAAGQDGILRVWEMDDPRLSWQADLDRGAIWHLRWPSSGKILVVSSQGAVTSIDADPVNWLEHAQKICRHLPESSDSQTSIPPP